MKITKRKTKEKIEKETGITLIALVITIIILLILASVTIAAISGDNGILNNASLAKISTEFANYKEEVELYKADKLLENLNFDEETLTAGETSLKYDGKPEDEDGNIKTVITDLDDKYLSKFIIINGKLYIMATGETSDIEIKAAQNTGIEVMPYEITEEGELLSSNKNLGLQGSNGTITIPEIVTSIGDGAFRDVEGLKTIIIPGTVKKIGDYAFSGNPTLENVIMEEGVETIGAFAFQDCTSLKEIHIADSVSSIGNTCFGGCTSLETINFPTSLKEIPPRMLSNCDALTEIIIPEGIENIGNMAFENCDRLIKVTIPSTVNYMGTSIVRTCGKLENIEVSKNSKNYKFEESSLMSFDGRTLYCILSDNDDIVDIPETVEVIKQGSLDNLKSNSTINIGKNVSNIEGISGAIKSINVIEENQSYASINGNLYNKDITILIKYCNNEETVILPDTLKEIKEYAFIGNANVQKIVLNEKFETLNSFCFTGTNITELYLYENVKKLSTGAFDTISKNIEISISEENPNYTVVDNTYILSKDGKKLVAVSKNLENYTIPDTVEEIGGSAFYNCSKLVNMAVPSTVKIIASSAFDNSTNLQKVEIPSSIESIATDAFRRCNSLTQIIVDKKEGEISGEPWGCPYGLRAVIWNG